MASDSVPAELSTRGSTGVHPAGAVIVAVFGRTAMVAIMTSPATVPLGLLILLPKMSWLNSNQLA